MTAPKMRYSEYIFLTENVYNLDPRESLRRIRSLFPHQRKIIERLLLGRTGPEICDETGMSLDCFKSICWQIRQALGIERTGELGRIYWSAMSLGVAWEKKYGHLDQPTVG